VRAMAATQTSLSNDASASSTVAPNATTPAS
jgi:hypothetical protein